MSKVLLPRISHNLKLWKMILLLLISFPPLLVCHDTPEMTLASKIYPLSGLERRGRQVP